MNKLFAILSIAIFIAMTLFATAGSRAASAHAGKKTVLISEFVEHPALDATVRGIIDGLAANGYKRGSNLDLRVESAQANPALASQIANKFINLAPDVVVGVGTISAQSFAKAAAAAKVKLAFSSVTDPLGASLVKSLQKPGNHTSGVSNFVALEPQLKLFQQLQPQLKRLGILYNPGEINSVSIVKKLEKICPSLGITLVKQTAPKTADVAQSATKLAQNADAIFISNDNTALSALQSVVRVAQKAKIPVYVSDTDAVFEGALAALGPNQYQVGFQTGEMIARVLHGEKMGEQSVEFPVKTDLFINAAAAKCAGINIPQQLLKMAAKVIDTSSACTSHDDGRAQSPPLVPEALT